MVGDEEVASLLEAANWAPTHVCLTVYHVCQSCMHFTALHFTLLLHLATSFAVCKWFWLRCNVALCAGVACFRICGSTDSLRLCLQGKTEPWRFTVLASHAARMEFYDLVQQVVCQFLHGWSECS